MLFIFLLKNYRFIIFFYAVYVFFFIIFSFHAITEEVCIGMCFCLFMTLLLFWLTKSGTASLKKVWYNLFLEGFDLVNLSSVVLYKSFLFVFLNNLSNHLFSVSSFIVLFVNYLHWSLNFKFLNDRLFFMVHGLYTIGHINTFKNTFKNVTSFNHLFNN